MGGGKGSSGPSKKEIAAQEARYQEQIDLQKEQNERLQQQYQDQLAYQQEYEQRISDERAAQEAATEQARIDAGVSERDTLYAERLDAATQAAEFVSNEIAKEAANARLMNIDYNVTEEQKAGRISDTFADIWSGASEEKLEQLFTDFGTPEGFEGFLVTRGTGTGQAPAGTAGPTPAAGVSGGYGPRGTVVDEDVDETEALGGGTILA